MLSGLMGGVESGLIIGVVFALVGFSARFFNEYLVTFKRKTSIERSYVLGNPVPLRSVVARGVGCDTLGCGA